MRVPGYKLCLQKLADGLEVQWEYCKSRGYYLILGYFWAPGTAIPCPSLYWNLSLIDKSLLEPLIQKIINILLPLDSDSILCL